MEPVLKWAGSKRVLGESARRVFDAAPIQYCEPCVGAAWVYSKRVALGEITPGPHVVLADLNAALIAFYRGLRTDPEAVIRAAERKNWGLGWRDEYQQQREVFNTCILNIGDSDIGDPEFCALFLWMNRACFNGLYRVSSTGKFNTPAGSYIELSPPTAQALRVFAQGLAGVRLLCAPFQRTLALVERGWQVYIDPPYYESYDGYTNTRWDWNLQVGLAMLASDAQGRGAHIVASNADHPKIRALWGGLGFDVRRTSAYHSVGASGERRKQAGEVIMVGCPPQKRLQHL